MPVCTPAMPTDPDGTRTRGDLPPRHRDARVDRAEVREAGTKPSMKTRYDTALWRAMTSASLRPANRPRPRGPDRTRRRSRPARRTGGRPSTPRQVSADAASSPMRSWSASTSVANGSKYTATDRKVGTTSRTPRTRSRRSASASAIARAFSDRIDPVAELDDQHRVAGGDDPSSVHREPAGCRAASRRR